MEVSSEIFNVKKTIQRRIAMDEVKQEIRNVINGVIHKSPENINFDELISALRSQGVVDNIVSSLNIKSKDKSENGGTNEESMKHQIEQAKNMAVLNSFPDDINPSERHLFLRILKGTAMIDHLGQIEPSGQTFSVHIYFRNQRFRSKAVPCQVEPEFYEGFMLQLRGADSSLPSVKSLVSQSDPIHILLIRESNECTSQIVSSIAFDWRDVLTRKTFSYDVTLPLHGVAPISSGILYGTLQLSLQLLPLPVSFPLSSEVISVQRQVEEASLAKRNRLFLVYVKQWWQEYSQIRPDCRNRLVKLFTQDERGSSRFVCSFVYPVRASRLLSTARESAHFVSLIGRSSNSSLGQTQTDIWLSPLAFLALNEGEVENHAILLCSLLLGFGLDAYVCIGTTSKGQPHAWCMTQSPRNQITFWEPLTSRRYLLGDYPCPYMRIGCVFSHDAFYANCQSSDSIENCNFDLSRDSAWKSIPEEVILSVCGSCNVANTTQVPLHIPLCANVVDEAEMAEVLESKLKNLILEKRKESSLSTVFDESLAYLLSEALAAYETERCTGLTIDSDDFQDALLRLVPEGHKFQGYPAQFTHTNVDHIFPALLRTSAAETILCRGNHVRLAIRTRICAYPERTMSVWIMLASLYCPVI